MNDEQRGELIPKNLLSVEFQTEVDVRTRSIERRMFVKLYFEARDSGLLTALGDRRWRTLTVLATYMDENGYCYPSQATIAKILGVTRQTANERIQELLDFRWQGEPVLTLHKDNQPRNEAGKWGKNVYRIYPVTGFTMFDGQKTLESSAPSTVSAFPDTAGGGTVSGFTDSANPDTNKNQVKNETHTPRVSSSSKKPNLAPGAYELVDYFHDRAGHSKPYAVLGRENQQASTLITTHGQEAARSIVDFAIGEARETNFNMRHFGAVLGYVTDAVAHLSRKAEARQRAAQEDARRREEDAARERERAELERLSPAERIARRLQRNIDAFRAMHRREPSPLELREIEERIRHETESRRGAA